MKLLRYGRPGREKPGLLDRDGVIRDLSGKVDDLTPTVLSPAGLAKLGRLNPARLPKVPGRPRLGPCLASVGKIVGIGLNYRDHALESGARPPKEPIIFMKATTSITGPNDPIVLPKGSKKTDWEVELGVVIGTRARYVTQRAALDHVAGYCVFNDVSERSYQLEGTGQWVKGKSPDSFGPIGPYLVTADEVPNPQALRVWLDLNGERAQDSNTKLMLFGVKKLISFASRFMTLEPGDVIATGTPAGVGMGRRPQRFLKAGDELRLGVEGLGEQRQKVVSFRG